MFFFFFHFLQTYVDGVRVDNVAAMRRYAIRPEKVLRTLGAAVGQMMLVDGLIHADLHMGNAMVDRKGRVALLDFGQTKRISDDLRLKLCAFYQAQSSGHSGYIAHAFAALGIELDMPEQPEPSLLALIPVYANGLLDTQPLPADVDISPFSSRSPLQQVAIKRFPPELLMILRTVGALRALAEALQVDGVPMSDVFLRFARKGARVRVDAAAEARRERLTAEALTNAVASPFTAKPQGSFMSRWWG